MPEQSFSAAVTAVDLLPTHLPVLINAALAYYRLGKYARSVELLGRAIDIDPQHGKSHGYMGRIYYDWSTALHTPQQQQLLLQQQSGVSVEQVVAHLREESLAHLTQAISLGFEPPSILHLCGSAHFDSGDLDVAVRYYEAALHKSNELTELVGGSTDVYVEDDINVPFTYNQLGNAYRQLDRPEQALKSFEKGLQAGPETIQILNNIGNLYREVGDFANARTMMQKAIKLHDEHNNAPSAIVNNLGLLELDEQNFATAEGLFKRALQQLRKEHGAGSSISTTGESYSANGMQAEEIINNNILRAQNEAAAAQQQK
jgi:tetratricopeptide (TPR) repeat protein